MRVARTHPFDVKFLELPLQATHIATCGGVSSCMYRRNTFPMSLREGHHFLNGIEEAVKLLSAKIHLPPHHDDTDHTAE